MVGDSLGAVGLVRSGAISPKSWQRLLWRGVSDFCKGE